MELPLLPLQKVPLPSIGAWHCTRLCPPHCSQQRRKTQGCLASALRGSPSASAIFLQGAPLPKEHCEAPVVYTSGDTIRPGVARLEVMSPRSTGTHFSLECGTPRPEPQPSYTCTCAERGLPGLGLGRRSQEDPPQGQAGLSPAGRWSILVKAGCPGLPRAPAATGLPVPPSPEGERGEKPEAAHRQPINISRHSQHVLLGNLLFKKLRSNFK